MFRTLNRLRVTLAVTLAVVVVVGVGDAAAGDQAVSDAERYDYTCGHLGDSCEATPKAKRPRRTTRRAEPGCGRAPQRAGRRNRG